ncbi:xylan 1,4-beta-xylosidase [Microbacterium terrae]|uniref:Beta-xylosidase n=1 Tax=Microbacterium terrae TaxID=69369 RepID=A0A0M2HEN2_9MICO|nr:family 43 glycosylhydrolase [Microbacterium terrae]KJL42673.1 Beta-xylosidase [Microbacterium terrae]MBP1079103.1 xylan 1,4-beta-xylosidase [Microbacterium terrae]GLJ98505.1 alpha-N-arabinofuranosidase [Microbacterium terrae]
MATIHNPVLRGFNPDPSIVRVGEDYYLATSTFEYHPAVRLHHSRDLANWTVVGHALDDGFDLQGIPDSGGVWAPSLSHTDGTFWLAYSIVRTMDGDDKDIDNYLVTADSIEGPWSEPIHLGSRGFDFSFFHDTDGTHWIVGVQWDQRPEHASFSGLVLEQYLPDERRTSGEATVIYREDVLVEGPNLYRIGDEYVLTIASGGTGWNHSITTARSANLTGPYERDPWPAMLTSRDAPGTPLQKAGHGELVQTPGGEWMLAHLASRPTLHLGERYCTLGRETSLQAVVFEDGWLRLRDGGHHGEIDVEIPGVEREVGDAPSDQGASWTDTFADGIDSRRWSTLRVAPDPAVFDTSTSSLRLRGGHSTASVFEQSLLLTRVQEHHATFEAVIDAEPRTTREAAGIVAWYDRQGWIWMQLSWDETAGRSIRVIVREPGRTTRSDAVSVPDGALRLRAELHGPALTFAWATETGEWMPLPGEYPAWMLSDDFGPRLRFTGMFFGVRAEDLDGRGWGAGIRSASLSQTQV